MDDVKTTFDSKSSWTTQASSWESNAKSKFKDQPSSSSLVSQQKQYQPPHANMNDPIDDLFASDKDDDNIENLYDTGRMTEKSQANHHVKESGLGPKKRKKKAITKNATDHTSNSEERRTSFAPIIAATTPLGSDDEDQFHFNLKKIHGKKSNIRLDSNEQVPHSGKSDDLSTDKIPLYSKGDSIDDLFASSPNEQDLYQNEDNPLETKQLFDSKSGDSIDDLFTSSSSGLDDLYQTEADGPKEKNGNAEIVPGHEENDEMKSLRDSSLHKAKTGRSSSDELKLIENDLKESTKILQEHDANFENSAAQQISESTSVSNVGTEDDHAIKFETQESTIRNIAILSNLVSSPRVGNLDAPLIPTAVQKTTPDASTHNIHDFVQEEMEDAFNSVKTSGIQNNSASLTMSDDFFDKNSTKDASLSPPSLNTEREHDSKNISSTTSSDERPSPSTKADFEEMNTSFPEDGHQHLHILELSSDNKKSITLAEKEKDMIDVSRLSGKPATSSPIKTNELANPTEELEGIKKVSEEEYAKQWEVMRSQARDRKARSMARKRQQQKMHSRTKTSSQSKSDKKSSNGAHSGLALVDTTSTSVDTTKREKKKKKRKSSEKNSKSKTALPASTR